MKSATFEEPHLQSLLEEIARNEDFVKPKFEISLGSKPGDNYIGRINRAVVIETSANQKMKGLSLIFKLSPKTKERIEQFSCVDVFRIEGAMYQQVLPTLNQILNKFGVVKSDIFPGTARCEAVQLRDGPTDERCDVLVLEDKAVTGFSMLDANMNKQFDLNHCKLVLQKLSYLHASSMALNHHDPHTAEKLRKLLDYKNIFFVNAKHPLMSQWREGAANTLKSLQEPFKEGSNNHSILKQLVDNFEIEMAKSNAAPSDLFCITHGDCWFNNILYQYNKDGSLNDVCLVDLQLCRVASPAVDVAYMLFLCTTKGVRDAHYDELIRFYHDQVCSHLKKMECDPGRLFSWETLQTHLRKYSKTGILMALACMGIMTADSECIQVDVNSASANATDDFSQWAKITDPKKLAEISNRTTDVMVDCLRWNYI